VLCGLGLGAFGAPGQQVVLRLVGTGGRQSSRTTATTLPGLAWRRLLVEHTVTARTDLSLEITAEAVLAGGASYWSTRSLSAEDDRPRRFSNQVAADRR
jgi:hypothetical protein